MDDRKSHHKKDLTSNVHRLKSKTRLDHEVVHRGLVATRSQAESFIRLGKVQVDGRVITKPGYFVSETHKIKLAVDEQYVSRAGMKLASVAEVFNLDFRGKTVLDVGSSTGGFTDYSLKHGAEKVIAVDVGTNQLHPSLRNDSRIELHEQLDIRNLKREVGAVKPTSNFQLLTSKIDIVVLDVSFISLREILPHIKTLISGESIVVPMVKPQFEATATNIKHKGVIKNEAMRRDILKDFELWVKQYFKIVTKTDSQVAGEKGNRERFYVLKPLS